MTLRTVMHRHAYNLCCPVKHSPTFSKRNFFKLMVKQKQKNKNILIWFWFTYCRYGLYYQYVSVWVEEIIWYCYHYMMIWTTLIKKCVYMFTDWTETVTTCYRFSKHQSDNIIHRICSMHITDTTCFLFLVQTSFKKYIKLYFLAYLWKQHYDLKTV